MKPAVMVSTSLMLLGCTEPASVGDPPAASATTGSSPTTSSGSASTGEGPAGSTSAGRDPGRATSGPPAMVGSSGSSEVGSSTGGLDLGGGQAVVTFEEVAVSVGIDVVHHSLDPFATQGQAWGDVDGDGVLDLMLTSQLEPNHLLRGVEGGTFEPVDAPAVVLADTESTGAVFVDVDNDGWQDLYVLARGPNSLLLNAQGAGFVDVSLASGLDDAGFGETAAWGDYDRDGLVDVYVVNNDPLLPDRLFHNEGEGVFSDTGEMLAAQTRTRLGFSASFFDYDNDGDSDLYVVNDKFGGNVLWRNDGPGCEAWCWTDVSAVSGAGVEMNSMGLGVGDYDNDGDLDAFISNFGPMVLLQNQAAQGAPVFVEVAAEAGTLVDEEMWWLHGWGAQFLDYDNDGWLDLYVALSRMNPGPDRPNVMLRNLGDGSFERLPAAAGAEDYNRSQGLAIADYDADGWVDLLVGNLEAPYALFRNGGGEGHWLEVELRGDGSVVSTDALGARVSVLDDAGRVHTREVIAGSSLGSGSSLRQHFGLGLALPVSISIDWPDGTHEVLAPVPADVRVVHAY